VVSRESMVEAIRKSMKPKIVELNIQALDAGMNFAAEFMTGEHSD
jgi:Pyruvate/2-oxoacid:ferredoxin oxidoreductase gamma subunit